MLARGRNFSVGFATRFSGVASYRTFFLIQPESFITLPTGRFRKRNWKALLILKPLHILYFCWNRNSPTVTMSEQQKPKSPVLCKMGCGFFGCDATGNCCSKCWMESLKKNPTPAPAAAPKVEATRPNPGPVATEAPEPMEICEETTKAPPSAAPEAATTTTKKKTKKTSYKAMLAGMMTAQNNDSKMEKEREALKKGLGGGAFTKVEKI